MTILNYGLQQNYRYTSTDGHKFSRLHSTYAPLSRNIFIKHGLQSSSEALCSTSQGPGVLHKQRRGVLAEPPSQQQWRGALVDSEPAYVRPAQCPPPPPSRLPAAETAAGERQRSAKCPLSHTQTLSRKLLSYS